MNNVNLQPVQNKQTWTVRILSVLIILIAGGFLYTGIESYQKVTDIGFNEEARKQPFLAAKLFLEQEGTQVQLLEDYRLLYASSEAAIFPDGEDTIVLSEGEIALSNNLANQLIDWVNAGGHLVMALNASQDADVFRANELIQRLNLAVSWLPEDSQNEFMPTEIINPQEQPLMVNLERRYRLVLPEDPNIFYTAGDLNGPTFAQMEMGDGLITLLTEVYIWNNYQIANEDNVELLAQLAGNSSKVYLFSSRELPHWFSLLYDFAPYFIWFSAVLLALSMWHWSMRFGPIFRTHEDNNTPFSMHIKAAGEFYWRHKRQNLLVEEIRHSIIVALHKKRPSTKSAERQQLLEQLSGLSGWSTEIIDALMFSQTQMNEMQFTQRIASLQTLRKML
ncbi:DUF4350 domain-containing protein [Aliiglaciecola sp. 3_MG-2023]|uniref:DUF4350 domain-containing protein n=1 Tax=Aliiglaciecola sp. 3_MG-2023 TaxID=3062644 RepID=UPI0026E43556|nr:DUF4350 domain-containing protein [Aliiglaciecola sp. 3_MG-2023]MDO6692014.1 DUF4350 domain-containing protein [Aliiglaciecola sp. 3_MG-2023]